MEYHLYRCTSLFKHFFKILSLYLEARIRIWLRIRIKVKGRIRIRLRIRIKVTSRIRIRIKVMRIRNTAVWYLDPAPQCMVESALLCNRGPTATLRQVRHNQALRCFTPQT
jgi:hypothetical protein